MSDYPTRRVSITDVYEVEECAGSVDAATGDFAAYLRDDAAPDITVDGKGEILQIKDVMNIPPRLCCATDCYKDGAGYIMASRAV